MSELKPNQIMQLQKDFDRIREKVEKLTGERGNGELSAVRRVELHPLASMKMQSAQIAAAPTQADYNALQADVDAMFNALKRISNILGNASIIKA